MSILKLFCTQKLSNRLYVLFYCKILKKHLPAQTPQKGSFSLHSREGQKKIQDSPPATLMKSSPVAL